jgi:hypothetical protein
MCIYEGEPMTKDELQVKLLSGEVVEDNGAFYEKSVYEELQHAKRMEERYDLLQLTKKIQL